MRRQYKLSIAVSMVLDIVLDEESLQSQCCARVRRQGFLDRVE